MDGDTFETEELGQMIHRVSEVFCSLMIVAGFACLSGSMAHAQTAASASPGETAFKTNCSMCHGADGAGSPFGKRLGAPDLRSKEVHDLSSEALAKIISGGKNNMPAFGTRLDSTQIQQLVEYIRHLHAAQASAK